MSEYARSVTIAYVVVFSALAISLTFSRAEIPFPLLPYLKFDFAEIPVMLALLLGGLAPGLATAVIHWIGLSMARGWVLGPLMKFLAVAPMVVGFWLGIKIWKIKSLQKSMVLAFPLGAIFRVMVCAIANTIVFLFVAPDFLKFSVGYLKAIGLNVSSEIDALLWTLAFNAIFNVLHVILSAAIAVVIFIAAIKRIPGIAGKVWLPSKTK
ncbi:MAG: hypothetical protein QXJ19_02160 [Candidatus Bathyarchaeia archaeon]|nr:hypothetical protein [Candidatus Bathyarchaeota archaeon]